MRKVVVVLVLAVFLLSTGSWAKVGRVTLGAIYSSKSASGMTASLSGLQAKYGVTDNFDLEGRGQLGYVYDTSPLVTLTYISGLGVYNLNALSDRFVPYVGAGFVMWTVSSGTTWTLASGGQSYSSLVALLGFNAYFTDQFAFTADVVRESISTASVTGVTLGLNYTF